MCLRNTKRKETTSFLLMAIRLIYPDLSSLLGEQINRLWQNSNAWDCYQLDNLAIAQLEVSPMVVTPALYYPLF